MTSFSFTLLVSQRRLMLRSWGEELLRRDNVDKGWGKEAYPPAGTSLQGFLDRSYYSCESSPVGEYLQVLASQTFSQSGRSPLSWCRCQADDTVAKECD